jgi:hypothetical protein
MMANKFLIECSFRGIARGLCLYGRCHCELAPEAAGTDSTTIW